MTPPLDVAALRALPNRVLSACSHVVHLPGESHKSLETCPAASHVRQGLDSIPALLAELEGLRKIEGAARALASAVPDFSWSSDRMDECRLYGDGRAIYELADRLFGLVDRARGEGR